MLIVVIFAVKSIFFSVITLSIDKGPFKKFNDSQKWKVMPKEDGGGGDRGQGV